ncbi:NUDIX hydrolase [Variovorax humicola]|uniref:NUDIX hydrolase n=1 Tax=Variovorax humicola TaxID=1769758 RepID=A0ABU8WAX1_9BURK
MTAFHPRLDDAGQPVSILHPSVATPAAAWADPSAVVVVVPDGEAPAALNGVPVAPWQPPADWWDAEAARRPVAEPPFAPPAGLAPAAGVVLLEPDGRVWLAQPSNGFGGVAHVVPKGRHDAGLLAAAAMREAWEELGLVTRLTGHLIDLARTMTFTRYYVGRRIGGHPGAMGWESQASILCPIARLHELLTRPHDGPLVAAILAHRE